jgi:hypothetical protein
MRTTLTLDDDIAAKLKAECRRSGASFRDVVNSAIRRGLATPPSTRRRAPFKVIARDLGALRVGLSLDNVAELLDQVEGPAHR